MTDNVVKFYSLRAALAPDVVLEHAAGVYDEVLVIGYNKDSTGQRPPKSCPQCTHLLPGHFAKMQPQRLIVCDKRRMQSLKLVGGFL